MPKAPSPSLILQDRDIALLRDLFESRIMTSAHIAAIHFGGKAEMTKKRLQRLKAKGYVAARPRKLNEAAVLFLTRKGCTFLRESGLLAEYPPISPTALERRIAVSNRTVRHELAVMDVKAAFYLALRSTKGCRIEEFSTWPLLYQFETSRSGYGSSAATVKPDGFIRIRAHNLRGGMVKQAFFVEVDRSTESQDILVSRALSYLQYYRSGGFSKRSGGTPYDIQKFPFRVLMVFKSAERRNNTAERLLLLNPPILTQVFLTTLNEVTTNPFGSIWICPLDYRNALRGTTFDVSRSRPREYGRQTERDLVMDNRVKRSRILEATQANASTAPTLVTLPS